MKLNRKVTRALVPSLVIGRRMDIPLNVSQVESTEVATGNKQTSLLLHILRFLERNAHSAARARISRMRKYYREALNTKQPALSLSVSVQDN